LYSEASIDPLSLSAAFHSVSSKPRGSALLGLPALLRVGNWATFRCGPASLARLDAYTDDCRIPEPAQRPFLGVERADDRRVLTGPLLKADGLLRLPVLVEGHLKHGPSVPHPATAFIDRNPCSG